MSNRIDKRRVAKSFSRAAKTYDDVATLQRTVADQLLHYIGQASSLVKGDSYNSSPFSDVDKCENHQQPRTVLDLGCGTGYATAKLQNIFPVTQLVSIDLAEGMLQHCRQTQGQNLQLVCADAEQLPFANASFDLLFSSLAIQWCQNTKQLFAEIARVLKPGGEAWISTLGPNTLYELRNAWRTVDDLPHVNSFDSAETLVRAARPYGRVDMQAEVEVLRYPHALTLVQELRSLGAHNVQSGMGQGLATKNYLRQMFSGYEPYRGDDGLLPASYEVFYIRLIRSQQ